MKKVLFFCALFFFSTVGHSQTTGVSMGKPLKHNAFYLELGGNSFLYSVNYDRLIPLSKVVKLAVGSGVEYVTNISVNETSYGSSFCLTPAANLLIGRSSHHFETGLSAFIPFSAGIVLPAVRLGYRYQPANGGFLFRAGVTPFVVGGVLPWGGLSFGYVF